MFTPLITRPQDQTYLARVPGTPHKLTCTSGEIQAARNLIEKHYGKEVVATLKEATGDHPFKDIKLPKNGTLWIFGETPPLMFPETPARATKAEVVEVELVKDQPTTTEDKAIAAFEPIRFYDRSAQIAVGFAAACAVMAGHQLLDLQKAFGYTRGRPSKETKALALVKPADTWKECVEQFAGISLQTASIYMRLAEEGRKRVKTLSDLVTDKTSLTDLSTDQREIVLKEVQRVTDGATMAELMREWGIAKPALKIPKGEPKKDKKEDIIAKARLLVSSPILELRQSRANPESWSRSLYKLPKDERQDLLTELSATVADIELSLK